MTSTAAAAFQKLTLTTPSDREIAMTRVFAAPRRLVFDALTKPELVRRWLLGPPGWSMPVCDIDLRVGGTYRYEWRHSDGTARFDQFERAGLRVCIWQDDQLGMVVAGNVSTAAMQRLANLAYTGLAM